MQECLRRFVASGLDWPVTLDEAALEALLYPREVVVDQTLPDFAAVAARLGSFKGMGSGYWRVVGELEESKRPPQTIYIVAI